MIRLVGRETKYKGLRRRNLCRVATNGSRSLREGELRGNREVVEVVLSSLLYRPCEELQFLVS